MGALAVIAAIVLDKPLVDPEGFLGPSWLRLPLLLLGAFLLDMLPRTLWYSRLNPTLMPRHRHGAVCTTHWNRERITLVVLGLVCFYITYVSYRNLKSFLPFIMGDKKYDRELHLLDQALFFGHEPGDGAARRPRHRAHRRTSSPRSTCGSCRWCRWRSPPGWSGRATSPSATGSPPRSAWPGPSAPRPTTRCPPSAPASSTPGSTPTSPTPAPAS